MQKLKKHIRDFLFLVLFVITSVFFVNSVHKPVTINPNYNPFADIPKDKLRYANNYKFANSVKDVQKINARIDKELENKKILNEEAGTGTQLISLILVNLIDPIYFIPMGWVFYRIYKKRKIRKAIWLSSSIGFISSLIKEIILHNTQELRTIEDSMFNILVLTLFSGILGGLYATLVSRKKNRRSVLPH